MDERGGFILLTFDLHNLNFSCDLQEVMGMLRFCADRVRVVLHRADLIDAASQSVAQECGPRTADARGCPCSSPSFWNQSHQYQDHRASFDEDTGSVLKEFEDPRTAVLRKINDFVMRLRHAKTHRAHPPEHAVVPPPAQPHIWSDGLTRRF